MKVKIDGYIAARKEVWDVDVRYSFFSCDMSDHGYVTVMPHSIEIDIPNSFNMDAAMIDLLMKKKEKLLNEFNKRIEEINEEISKYSALTYVDKG